MKRWRSEAKRVISLLPVNVYLEARTQPGADIMPCIISWCSSFTPPPLPLYQLRQIFQARQVISSLLLLRALFVVAELTTTWSGASAKELVGKEVFRKKEKEEREEEGKGWKVKEDHPQGQSITCLSLTPSAKPQSIRLER